MASESDPLIRHWFRLGGGNPDDLVTPWGTFCAAVQGTMPSVYEVPLLGPGHYVCQYEGSNDNEACNAAASEFLDEAIKAGFSVTWANREAISGLAGIEVP